MSTLATADSQPHRLSRSRSSSVTGTTSTESPSSDSPPTSDPDIHFTDNNVVKSLFAMDVDAVLSTHILGMEPGMSFDGDFELHQGGVHNQAPHQRHVHFDEVVLDELSGVNTTTKDDILMLEEIIKDGAFESSSNMGPTSHPSRSPTFCDASIPLPPFLDHRSHHHPHSPSDTVGIDPSSTQYISPSQASSVSNVPSLSKPEFSNILLLSPATQGNVSTPPLFDSSTSHSLGTYDPTPPRIVSREVVYPHKDVCVDLPIFFPSVPAEGTKSRVETQIKLVFELALPALTSSLDSSERAGLDCASSSSSPSNSPNASLSQAPTHDKVGTYRFLRLPHGTATKRMKSDSLGNRKSSDILSEVRAEDTLDMSAEVICSSPPHALVQSCASCQSREAKRTARKLSARVRPSPGLRGKPKSKRNSRKGNEQHPDVAERAEAETEEEEEEEPNVDASIIQFNCAEIVDFSEGSVVLPIRITCYCRHHKEKIGFNVVFTLRDHLGRIVGRGTTPPILITDDHKSNNAVSKLPPMHPLRRAMHPVSSAYLPRPLCSEEVKPLNSQASFGQSTSQAPCKGRDTDTLGKKRRPKPYDGRPLNRTAIVPSMEGHQGAVLALHPAHSKTQTSVVNGSAGGVTESSSRATTASPGAEYHALSSSETYVRSPGDVKASTLDSRLSRDPSHIQLLYADGSLPSPLSSPRSELQELHSPLQTLPNFQSSPTNQRGYPSPSFSLYPSIDATSLPKIHRLIPSSGPTTGGIEITVLGSNFHPNMQLECVFGGVVASSTHRWSDSTLVCVLPPRAVPGPVGVGFKGIKKENTVHDDSTCIFNYVDESERQLMELALQVVGLKMTGKIEEARNVAMRIVGNTNAQMHAAGDGQVSQNNSLTNAAFAHHTYLGSLRGVDLETLVIKLLTLLDVPPEGNEVATSVSHAIGHQNATGQTLLHLAVILALPALVSCLAQRSIDLDACNTNGLTPLHFAALTGWKKGAEILLAAGADPSIVDRMGFTAADWARYAHSSELKKILEEAAGCDKLSDSRSGDEGDDEAWHDGDEVSLDEDSDTNFPLSTKTTVHSPDSSESSESYERQREHPSAQSRKTLPDVPAPPAPSSEECPNGEKQEPSFVGLLQRSLAQGILPNVQISGFPQLQLPEMLADPWGALPQIPVFPIFVPMPNLPHLPNWPVFPWTDGEKKGRRHTGQQEEKEHQQPPFGMLWAAYDNIANNAWRAHWEKWTAQVTALYLHNASTEVPPMYTPREEEKQSTTESRAVTTPSSDIYPAPSTDISTQNSPAAASSHTTASKAIRRVGYGSVKVPDTEVDSYHYQPKKESNHKKDRMLVLFWIPILIFGLAYALYTALPVAIASVSRATKRLIPHVPLGDGIVL